MFGEMFCSTKALGAMGLATPGNPLDQPLRPQLDVRDGQKVRRFIQRKSFFLE
jgi:hypothetical protein